MASFRYTKQQVIDCLQCGCVLHESRSDIDVKNLLVSGAVSIEQVVWVLKKARGNEYACSPHHLDATVDVHVVKTRYARQSWYIKWYFVEPDAVFISVHH